MEERKQGVWKQEGRKDEGTEVGREEQQRLTKEKKEGRKERWTNERSEEAIGGRK